MQWLQVDSMVKCHDIVQSVFITAKCISRLQNTHQTMPIGSECQIYTSPVYDRTLYAFQRWRYGKKNEKQKLMYMCSYSSGNYIITVTYVSDYRLSMIRLCQPHMQYRLS